MCRKATSYPKLRTGWLSLPRTPEAYQSTFTEPSMGLEHMGWTEVGPRSSPRPSVGPAASASATPNQGWQVQGGGEDNLGFYAEARIYGQDQRVLYQTYTTVYSIDQSVCVFDVDIRKLASTKRWTMMKLLPNASASPEELKSGPQSDPGLRVPTHNQLDSKPGAENDKAQLLNPLAEFDEYGTELHKDARVWKVYVNEADKHDTELANGWNESTDVILSSAVLSDFDCVPDREHEATPARLGRTVSPELANISETLSAIANGTRSPGSVPSPASDTAEFAPSRAAICVNVLWYLSLGLSLATSFIAILAKDWCHSFMSGRIGHPHSQMCRRQRKWNMIEKWKMSELLKILPSLVHLALLLFSVGLCIYLSDRCPVVAIPIFLVTGAAIGFYMWSSIAAINIDYFPYPTIISRIFPTHTGRHACQTIVLITSRFVSRFVSHPVIRNFCQVALALVLGCMWIFRKLLLIPAGLCSLLDILQSPLNRCDTYVAQSPQLLRILVIPLSKTIRYLVWYPASSLLEWISRLYVHLGSVEEYVKFRLSDANWGLEWPEWDPKAAGRAGDNDKDQHDVTSLALSWLITNCEVPQSVDIALQSIAGATSRTTRQPLLDCHTTLEILRRLASSSLYKGSEIRTNITVSLYSRALAWLGGATTPFPNTKHHESGSELEGQVWDVHLESEKRVAALIVNGTFDPTRANLDALRIGNTAATSAVNHLRRHSQKATVNIGQLLTSIFNRLASHVSDSEPLHEAALLSLVNAAVLLLPLAPDSQTVAPLRPLCMEVIAHQLYAPTPLTQLLVDLVVTCILTSTKLTDLENPSKPGINLPFRAIAGDLAEYYAGRTAILGLRSAFGLEALAAYSGLLRLKGVDSRTQYTMLNRTASEIDALFNSLARYQKGEETAAPEDDLLRSLRTLRNPLDLALVEPSRLFVPFLILAPIRLLWKSTRSPIDDEWAKLASSSRFPSSSGVLSQLIEESHFISHLEIMINQGQDWDRFIALGQLWLLFTIYFDTSSDIAEGRERLGAQLQLYRQRDPTSDDVLHASICDQLVLMWESDQCRKPGRALGSWQARLMECVYQSRDSQPPEDVYDQLQYYDVPESLRGLPSFTSWRPQHIETRAGNRLQSPNGTHGIARDENNVHVNIPMNETFRADKGDEADRVGTTGDAPVYGGNGASYGIGSGGNGLGDLGYEMTDGEEVNLLESYGVSTTLEGNELVPEVTGNGTGYLGVGSEDVGDGSSGNFHVSIDVHANESGAVLN